MIDSRARFVIGRESGLKDGRDRTLDILASFGTEGGSGDTSAMFLTQPRDPDG